MKILVVFVYSKKPSEKVPPLGGSEGRGLFVITKDAWHVV